VSFEIVVRQEAQIDLDEIFIWYEEQQRGLGLKFINAVDRIFSKISLNPDYCYCMEGDARSASLRKFPYDIIYRIDQQHSQIRVIAVIHQKRNPEWFRERLTLLE
jgi:plasmid stabilization system protein ParE